MGFLVPTMRPGLVRQAIRVCQRVVAPASLLVFVSSCGWNATSRAQLGPDGTTGAVVSWPAASRHPVQYGQTPSTGAMTAVPPASQARSGMATQSWAARTRAAAFTCGSAAIPTCETEGSTETANGLDGLIPGLPNATGWTAPRPATQPRRAQGAPMSPHWRHARFAAFDYRIHYLHEPQKTTEYNRAAARYDVVIGGDVDAWKSRNPTVQQYVYDLIKGEKFSPANDVGPMESWLAANGYNVEDTYLHVAAGDRSKADRVVFKSPWGEFWALNPADPGQVAWREEVTRRLTRSGTRGSQYDGIFYDVLGSGSGGIGEIPEKTLEFGSRSEYASALHELLKRSTSWMPSGRCMANTGTYLTAEDAAQADACGAVLMEYANNTYGEIGFLMWDFVSARMDAGTQVILVPQRQGTLKNTPRFNLNPGNFGSVAERVLMAEYANYLMLVDPTRMDLLAVDFYLTGVASPNQPHDIAWLRAFEVDIGLATGARTVLQRGTDGAGQPYDAYVREFENAIVIYRPMQNWARRDFGDKTAEIIEVPGERDWRMLLADGSTKPVFSSVRLRNGEAVILMK